MLRLIDDGYTVTEVAKVLKLRTEVVRAFVLERWVPLFVE